MQWKTKKIVWLMLLGYLLYCGSLEPILKYLWDVPIPFYFFKTSVSQFSCSVMSDSLQLHGPQHASVPLKLYFILFFLATPHSLWHLSWPGIEPGPPQWKPQILTTMPQGKSEVCLYQYQKIDFKKQLLQETMKDIDV